MQGLQTERQKEILDVAFLSIWASKGLELPHSEVIKNLYVDVSQAISRRPWGRLRTLCTGSQIYSFEKDRVLIAEESLRLLGFPTGSWTASLTQSDIMGFAGNAMALPSVAAVSLSLLLACFQEELFMDVARTV